MMWLWSDHHAALSPLHVRSPVLIFVSLLDLISRLHEARFRGQLSLLIQSWIECKLFPAMFRMCSLSLDSSDFTWNRNRQTFTLSRVQIMHDINFISLWLSSAFYVNNFFWRNAGRYCFVSSFTKHRKAIESFSYATSHPTSYFAVGDPNEIQWNSD